MGTLTFNLEGLSKLVDLSRIAEKRRPTWAQQQAGLDENTTPPGLWLVGDRGVYVVGNSADARLKDSKTGSMPLVYSNECNPNSTEDWFAVKRATFGCDDGSELLNEDVMGQIKAAKAEPSLTKMVVDISPTEFRIGFA